MNQILKKHKVLMTSTVLIFLVALTYVLSASKVYLSQSRVAIFRMKVENPDNGSDESRNRWIWIRDGLNINSALVTDDLINEFIKTSDIAKTYAQKYSTDFQKMAFFRSLVKVQYTGADESNYIIEVRATDSRLAHELNSYLFNHLKFLAIQKDNEDFAAIMDRLNQQAAEFPAKSGESEFYQNKILKMKFEHAIAQSQKERVFQVISAPAVNESPIWPKPLPILIVALFAGLALGFMIEYAIAFLKSLK